MTIPVARDQLSRELQDAWAAAVSAARTYDHEAAVRLYSRAIELAEAEAAREAGPAEELLAARYELLAGRAAEREFLAAFDSVAADGQAMQAVARNLGDPAREAAAAIVEGRGLALAGRSAEALRRIELALTHPLGESRLEGEASLAAARALTALGEYHRAEDHAERARAGFQRLGDPAGEAEALAALSYVAVLTDRFTLALERGEATVRLAQTANSPRTEARAFTTLAIASGDLAVQRTHQERALALFQAAGDQHGQAIARNNLAQQYLRLGLYDSALVHAQRVVRDSRARGSAVSVHALDTLANAHLGLRDAASAAAVTREGLAAAQEGGSPHLEGIHLLNLGQVALQGDLPAEAAAAYERATDLLLEVGARTDAAEALGWLGLARLRSGDWAAAEHSTRQAVEALDVLGHSGAAYPPQNAWLNRFLVLAARPDGGAGQDARAALERANRLMLESIEGLSDDGLRRNYLNKVEINREIVLAWARARAGDAADPRQDVEPARPGNLQAQFRRLLDLGARMNESRDPEELLGLVMNQLVELSGAERAVVALLHSDGRREAAATRGFEQPTRALELAASALDAAIDARAPVLLQGRDRLDPSQDASDPLEALSLMAVPLSAGGQLIGAIYADSRALFGPFAQTDLDLLIAFANQAATALENARLYRSLEGRVADRTADLSEANERLEQQNGELAIINGVQQGLASRLEMDAIYDLVGDKLAEIFEGQAVSITRYDHEQQQVHFQYLVEQGRRLRPAPDPFGAVAAHLIRTQEPLVFDSPGRGNKLGLGIVDGTSGARSGLIVPLVVDGVVCGDIGLENFEREQAFTPADVRLLSTLAASMSVALESARLFDETQRRARETATLVEVGREISATLELGEVLERIASRALAVLGGRDVVVRLLEPDGSLPAVVAIGPNAGPLRASPVRLGVGITGNIAQTGVAEIVNFPENDPRIVHVPGADDLPESIAFAPLVVRDRVIGVMNLWRDRATAGTFGPQDLEFTIGLAGQAAAAIQNARSFEAARNAQRAADAANTAKSTFLANMSHELRTPLNAIIGFTRIVRRKAEGALHERQLENLDKVLVSAEHLLGLINTVLDIAKIEAGHMDVQAAAFEVAPLVEACLATTGPLARPGVSLRADIQPDLPGLVSDQDKVRQVLLNLLSNAAKFTHDGTISVAARQADGRLRIEVADSGIGIDEEALGRIFEEFQQADTSTTRQYGGTGLGLSISRHLARLLGGDLTATSRPGAGSVFVLTLPIQQSAAALPGVEPSTQLAEPPAPERGTALVLAIDDDPDAVYLLREALAGSGYEVVGAAGGDEGIRQARALHPDAITLDIMMPQRDGWQVLHELKADPSTRDIPVVLLTVVDRKPLGYRLGAAEYLVKPPERDAVLAALDRATRKDGAGTPLRLLVVDDDPNVADLVRQLLDPTLYQVEAAADGHAALAAVAARRPDALLLDLIMPGLDGFGVLEQLRQTPEDAAIPVVVLTAKSLTPDEAGWLRDGAVRVMHKTALGGNLPLELRGALEAAAAARNPA